MRDSSGEFCLTSSGCFSAITARGEPSPESYGVEGRAVEVLSMATPIRSNAAMGTSRRVDFRSQIDEIVGGQDSAQSTFFAA